MLPSDMEIGAKDGVKKVWEPVHVDIGEIVA